jgi:hypothetical protein
MRASTSARGARLRAARPPRAGTWRCVNAHHDQLRACRPTAKLVGRCWRVEFLDVGGGGAALQLIRPENGFDNCFGWQNHRIFGTSCKPDFFSHIFLHFEGGRV